jgi:small nuclear ribonucleoprotein (snRNP)-like protein
MIIGSGITIGSGINITSEISGLYPFTTFTFTNANAIGNVGPTLAGTLNSYDTITNTWLSNSTFYNVINGVQQWTVPLTGSYIIEAWGANGAGSGNAVGKGAYVKGTFTLNLGEVIQIAVGQQGRGNVYRKDYPGGGGSFVVRSPYNSNASILAIAGGGGGASPQALGGNITGAAGAITTWGNVSGSWPFSGNSGNGAGSSNQTVQGGAGFFTNGFVYDNVTYRINDLSQPRSFTNASPVLGGYVYWSGTSGSPGLPGGFGGGGGTDRFQPSGGFVDAMGGGGGYSGGAGGYSVPYYAGGGGSYNTGTSQTMTSNVMLGNGQVKITYIGS